MSASSSSQSLLMSPSSDQIQEENAPLISTDKKENRGLIIMVFATLFFASMSLLVKIAQFPSSELVFVRSIFQFVVALIILKYYNIQVFGPSEARRYLVLRGTSGAVGLGLFYFAIKALPLADATTLFFTGPPLTALLAFVWLKEQYGKWDIISSAVCLAGVIMVSRPEFLFGQSDLDTLGVLAALSGAFMSAVAYCSVRKVTSIAKVHPMVHVFYFGMMSSLLSFVLMLAVEGSRWPSSIGEVSILIGIGVLSVLAQYLLNSALQIAPAGPATVIRNLDIVFAFIGGVLIVGEVPESALVWVCDVLGAVLVCFGAALSGVMRWYKSRL